MSEHNSGPGTNELDTAFLELVDDVAARSRRPGADQAVRTASHRRARSAAAVVVVLALVVGLGGWAVADRSLGEAPVVGVPSGGLSPSPAASTDHDDGPAPAPMSLQRLNVASKGWVRWQDGAGDADGLVICPATAPSAPGPQDATTQQYRTAGSDSAVLRQSRFASTRDSNLAMRQAVEAVLACPQSTGTFNHDVSAELEIVGVSWRSGGRHGSVWLVNHGSRMDVLRVVGPPSPPEEVRSALDDLIAADVQVP